MYQVTIKNYSSIARQLGKMMPGPVEIDKVDPAEEILKFAFSGFNKGMDVEKRG